MAMPALQGKESLLWLGAARGSALSLWSVRRVRSRVGVLDVRGATSLRGQRSRSRPSVSRSSLVAVLFPVYKFNVIDAPGFHARGFVAL